MKKRRKVKIKVRKLKDCKVKYSYKDYVQPNNSVITYKWSDNNTSMKLIKFKLTGRNKEKYEFSVIRHEAKEMTDSVRVSEIVLDMVNKIKVSEDTQILSRDEYERQHYPVNPTPLINLYLNHLGCPCAIGKIIKCNYARMTKLLNETPVYKAKRDNR